MQIWKMGRKNLRLHVLKRMKQDFGSGWILEGPAYVGPGTLVVVPGLFILS